MDLLLMLIGRLPIVLWLRQLVSKSPCLTAEEVVRFHNIDKTRRMKVVFKSIDEAIISHDFARSDLTIGIPAECIDLTIDVCNAYRSAGFKALWLGNPSEDEGKRKVFPHVLKLNL